MMYLRYALLAPLSLAFNLFVMFTAPIWAAWAAFTPRVRLPGVFALVHTHDDDDIYGSNTTHDVIPGTWFKRVKRATWWLWRNPGYGLDAYVLGFPSEGMVIIHDSGPTAAFDQARTSSRFIIMQAANGKRYFCYRRDQMLFGNRWCKIFIGWHWEAKAGGVNMIKVMVNPFRTHP